MILTIYLYIKGSKGMVLVKTFLFDLKDLIINFEFTLLIYLRVCLFPSPVRLQQKRNKSLAHFINVKEGFDLFIIYVTTGPSRRKTIS